MAIEKNEEFNSKYYTIDLLHIIKTLWRKAWVIAVCGLLAAVIGFASASFLIAPTYSSSIMLYVNNSSVSLGNTSFSISSSEITAAQNLVKTYIVMLKNRTTLEAVIEDTGVSYSYPQLYNMIEATSVNETEVLKVTVTTEDPVESAKIANSIAVVLPTRISEIIEGATMEVVDSAIVNKLKVAPSITNYTVIGFIIGILVSVLLVSIAAIMDDTIHDEEYILQNYNYPILAKVPDLLSSGSEHYRYYAQKKNNKQ